MSIVDILADRNISEVLHFTTNRGIVGVLAEGSLLSRYRLPAKDYLKDVLHVNATSRPEATVFFSKDHNWLDYVNLSITNINRRYFEVSNRWHQNNDVWWAILSFDSNIMSHDNVIFTTTNNAYVEKCKRAAGVDGLMALFSNLVERKPGWTVSRLNRPPHFTTCEQAEVLYPEMVSTQYLRKIYVQNGDHHDSVRSWLREFNALAVQVVISPLKFLGHRN